MLLFLARETINKRSTGVKEYTHCKYSWCVDVNRHVTKQEKAEKKQWRKWSNGGGRESERDRETHRQTLNERKRRGRMTKRGWRKEGSEGSKARWDKDRRSAMRRGKKESRYKTLWRVMRREGNRSGENETMSRKAKGTRREERRGEKKQERKGPAHGVQVKRWSVIRKGVAYCWITQRKESWWFKVWEWHDKLIPL